MGEPNIITLLRSKRARLAGEAESLEKRLVAIRDALSHVDAVLRLYGYTGDLSAIRSVRPKTIRFKRREFPALILEIMATGITQNRLIALETIRRKGWDADDGELVRKLADCVSKHKRGLDSFATGPRPEGLEPESGNLEDML